MPICLLSAVAIYWFLLSGHLSTPSIGFADCAWSATAQAWVDMDGNGVRNSSDPPLPGVTFHVNDIQNGYSDVGDADGPSDWKGEVQLSVWLPGCPDARFEVYPDIPEGFRALSDLRPTADAGSTHMVFDFGFSQLPGLPTVTPQPPSPLCRSYRLGVSNKYDITDIAIATDGTVWVSTFNDGLRKLLPGSSEWMHIDTADGLVNDQVRSITPLTDGSIWFGTEGGASQFGSNGWTSFTSAQGLINNSVYGIAASSDGNVWFATAGGVSQLNTQTLSWNSISADMISAVAVSPEGAVWVAPFLGNPTKVVLSDSGVIKFEDGFNFNYVDQFKFTPDGIMWIAGFDGIGKFSSRTGVLDVYNRMSSKGAFVDAAKDLDVAPDGSLWIAAEAYTPIIYHFLPWLKTDTTSAWQIYDQRDGLPTLPSSATNDDSVKAIAVTAIGDVWIATTEHATLCHFANK